MWTRLNLDQNQINKNFSKKIITAKTSFHQQVLNSWIRIHNIHPNNIIEILNQYLAYNQYIQIDNKHLYLKHNCLKMLSDIKLGDIITSRNTIMNHKELSPKYNFKIGNSKLKVIPIYKINYPH